MDSLLRKYIDIIEAAAPAPAATVPGTLKAGDGSTVVDGSGAPVQAGTQPAPAAAAPAEAPAAAPAAPQGSIATDTTDPLAANNQPAPAPAPAAPAEAPATTVADQDDADAGAAMTANAQAANGVNTAGQNVTMPNGINPETGTPTTPQQAATPAPAAAAPNYDTMPFGQAFGAARKAGAKDFTWKGKKYAVTMAPKQAATPNPAGTVKNAAGGLTTTNAGGAATSVTRNSRPVAPGSLRAQQQANQAAQPVKETFMKELNAMRRIAGLKDSGT
jgi:hypothetical protein